MVSACEGHAVIQVDAIESQFTNATRRWSVAGSSIARSCRRRKRPSSRCFVTARWSCSTYSPWPQLSGPRASGPSGSREGSAAIICHATMKSIDTLEPAAMKPRNLKSSRSSSNDPSPTSGVRCSKRPGSRPPWDDSLAMNDGTAMLTEPTHAAGPTSAWERWPSPRSRHGRRARSATNEGSGMSSTDRYVAVGSNGSNFIAASAAASRSASISSENSTVRRGGWVCCQ
mmetsp:Transcript_11785/g.24872  ORF Transcript_11785/g.24872 Transcript_11785/m.24872 type:complete len:229 (-) Transcript_11785:73-759(-)